VPFATSAERSLSERDQPNGVTNLTTLNSQFAFLPEVVFLDTGRTVLGGIGATQNLRWYLDLCEFRRLLRDSGCITRCGFVSVLTRSGENDRPQERHCRIFAESIE